MRKGRQESVHAVLSAFFRLHVEKTGIGNMMEGKIYGYIRVSSIDQNEGRQRLALAGQAITDRHIYMDKVSGKDFQRPQYQVYWFRLDLTVSSVLMVNCPFS